jgi:hypothetical protein
VARENSEQDTLYVGEFKGMATSGGTFGADMAFLDSLTNANVEKDGRLRKRSGSRLIYGLEILNDGGELFQFNYKGNEWILQRLGVDLQLYKVNVFNEQPFSITLFCNKSNVLKNATEPLSFAVKAEGDYCHVFVASRSTQLLSLTLVNRELTVATTNAGTRVATAAVGGFTTNVNQSNSKIILSDNSVAATTALSVNSSGVGSFTFQTAIPASVSVGSSVTLMSCFWLRYCDANYYAGTMLSNKGLRLNTIPLDVNVEVPESIRTNYIYNEPIQDLTIESLHLFENTNIAATRFSWIGNRNPVTSNSWDFSNGTYKNEAGKLTIRTPSFVTFGGLVANNVSSQINIIRLRHLLVGAFEKPTGIDIGVFVDKVSKATVMHRADGVPLVNYSTETPTYFSMTSTVSQSPGISLDSVCEVVYLLSQVGAGASNTIADISRDLPQITIGDGFVVPLYGYNLLAKQKSGVFPNKVSIVGNRMLLSGGSNLVLASAADWNFRGFTCTNMQVSGFNFSENSPYLLQIEQNGGNIEAIRSVNGVLIVATQTSTYRVTGSDRNSPPNASSSVISRLTNQIAVEANLVVVNNSVFMSNSNGLFSLEYKSENDEGVVQELSLAVADVFRRYTPTATTYSRVNESIQISFSGTNKVLTFSLRSNTWSYTHVSVPYNLRLFPSLDGFTFAVPKVSSYVLFVCVWNANETADLANVDVVSSATIGANQATISMTPNDVTGTFVLPPELLTTVSPTVKPAYNSTAVSSSNVVVAETAAGNVPKPIITSFVTKSFHNNKLTSAFRFRNMSLVLSKYGTAKAVIVPTQNSTSSKLPVFAIEVDVLGRVKVNNRKNAATTMGNEVAVVLSDLGISESFSLAVVFDRVEVLGFQLDTGAKANRKLAN